MRHDTALIIRMTKLRPDVYYDITNKAEDLDKPNNAPAYLVSILLLISCLCSTTFASNSAGIFFMPLNKIAPFGLSFCSADGPTLNLNCEFESGLKLMRLAW